MLGGPWIFRLKGRWGGAYEDPPKSSCHRNHKVFVASGVWAFGFKDQDLRSKVQGIGFRI